MVNDINNLLQTITKFDMPTEAIMLLLVCIVFAALFLVGYVLRVHLNVVKSITKKNESDNARIR